MAGDRSMDAMMELMRRHGIAAFEYSDDARHVVLAAGHRTVDRPLTSAPPGRATGSGTAVLTAPHAGIFRLTHPLEATAPNLPRHVERGEIVGYLQAGPLLRPVIATATGVLGAALVAEGATVGYGAPLFRLHVAETG